MWRARPAFALCATVRLPAGLEPARGKPREPRHALEAGVARPAELEPATLGCRRPNVRASPGPSKTIRPDFTACFEGGRQLLPTPDHDGVSHLCHTAAAPAEAQLRAADRYRDSRAKTRGSVTTR
jgi:hypothetical protein